MSSKQIYATNWSLKVQTVLRCLYLKSNSYSTWHSPTFYCPFCDHNNEMPLHFLINFPQFAEEWQTRFDQVAQKLIQHFKMDIPKKTGWNFGFWIQSFQSGYETYEDKTFSMKEIYERKTHDMVQVTGDTRHVTCDRWWALCKNFRSLAQVWDLCSFEDLGEKDQSVN